MASAKPKSTSSRSKKIDTAALQQQLSDLTVALQRERADVINIRRRHDEEITQLRHNARAAVITELLPVIDSFERAIQHIPKDIASTDFVKGIQAIVKQFEKSLTDLGVKRISSVGQPFDPELHEAVSAEGSGEDQIISHELQAGYQLNDTVLRHAIVRVRGEG